jgi:hypothetical protein
MFDWVLVPELEVAMLGIERCMLLDSLTKKRESLSSHNYTQVFVDGINRALLTIS